MPNKQSQKGLILTVFVIALLVGGIAGYAWWHDSTGADAYVRVESQAIPVPDFLSGQDREVVTQAILVNDFTYMDKTIQPNTLVVLDGKQYKGKAFQARQLPDKKDSWKHAQILVIPMTPAFAKALSAAKEKKLTYYYSDGSSVTKDIKMQ